MLRQILSTIRKSKMIRLSFLLSLLMFMSVVCITQYNHNMRTCYAITYSLGNGRGLTIFTPLYDEIDPLLQESVRVHEDRHLEVGSYAFWNHSALEIDAYEFQIKKLDERIAQFTELLTKTNNRKYAYNIYLLNSFKIAMLQHLHRYQGFKERDDNAN